MGMIMETDNISNGQRTTKEKNSLSPHMIKLLIAYLIWLFIESKMSFFGAFTKMS